MKKAVIILSILIYFSDAYSQGCGIAEKETIDNMVLYKAYLRNTSYRQTTQNLWELTSADPEYYDGKSYFYFDSNGNLRKHIETVSYPESLSTKIAYYNIEGELMYILFGSFDAEGDSYQGIAYKAHCGEYNDSIVFKYNVQYEFGVDFENRSTQGISSKYPAIIGSYSHIDSLKLFLSIEELQLPTNCKKVQFDKQISKNETAFINSFNINLREQPNTSSKIIRTMTVGERVNILGVFHQENINNLGNYNWYKIDIYGIEGYIFGAFLETVEKTIE